MGLRSQQLGWDSYTAEYSFHLQTGNGGIPVWGTPLSSLWCPATGDREMKRSCARGSSDWLRKVLHWEGAGALKQALLRSGCDTKPIGVQGASGICS